MKISLVGVANCRDLGGIATPYGTIAHNRLLRSGELSNAKQTDVDTLLCHKLQRIVDLRTAEEIQRNPDVAIDGVLPICLPILPKTTFGITFENSTGEAIAQRLEIGLERMRQKGETPLLHMQDLYQRFVQTEFCQHAYGSFLKLLANSPVEGATLWHCTAGKDRVGTCTALLLWCLGCTEEQIFDDYLETNRSCSQNHASVLKKVEPFVHGEKFQLVQTLLKVDKTYLQKFFQTIHAQFGSVAKFVEACGVSQQDIENLRKNYLC